jgi:hypothetical protein
MMASARTPCGAGSQARFHAMALDKECERNRCDDRCGLEYTSDVRGTPLLIQRRLHRGVHRPVVSHLGRTFQYVRKREAL